MSTKETDEQRKDRERRNASILRSMGVRKLGAPQEKRNEIPTRYGVIIQFPNASELQKRKSERRGRYGRYQGRAG